jgi:predicted HTH domain antitoxin
MTTVSIELPDSVFSALRREPTAFVREMRIEAATQWYAQRRVSQEKGAEIAGISRAEFIDELARRRIPVVQTTLEELREEVHRD